MLRLFFNPIAPLILFALLATSVNCLYVDAQLNPPLAIHYLVSFGWAAFLIIWMDTDALRRRCRPCTDFGMLLAFAYPMSVVWYCFWSRGWSGVLLLLVLAGLWLAPYFLTAVFAVVKFAAL